MINPESDIDGGHMVRNENRVTLYQKVREISFHSIVMLSNVFICSERKQINILSWKRTIFPKNCFFSEQFFNKKIIIRSGAVSGHPFFGWLHAWMCLSLPPPPSVPRVKSMAYTISYMYIYCLLHREPPLSSADVRFWVITWPCLQFSKTSFFM